MTAISSIRSFSNTSRLQKLSRKLETKKQIHTLPESERKMRSDGVRIGGRPDGIGPFHHNLANFQPKQYKKNKYNLDNVNFREDSQISRDSSASRHDTQFIRPIDSQMPVASPGTRQEPSQTTQEVQDNARSRGSL